MFAVHDKSLTIDLPQMADLPCALDANGDLLDASKMDWYNDHDDVEPMITRPSTPSSATSSIPISQAKLDWYLLPKGTRAAAVATGSWRSGRVSRPTKRAIEGGGLPDAKRVAMAGQNVDVGITEDLFEAGDDGEDDEVPALMEGSDSEDEEEDNVAAQEAAYEKTKAFGDADREASVLRFFHAFMLTSSIIQARSTVRKDDRTADIRTVFVLDMKGGKNKLTGDMDPDSWLCTVCK